MSRLTENVSDALVRKGTILAQPILTSLLLMALEHQSLKPKHLNGIAAFDGFRFVSRAGGNHVIELGHVARHWEIGAE